MTTARSSNRDRVEVRRFDDDLGRQGRDLRTAAAHDAGEPEWTGVVGNQQIVGIKRPRHAIEGLQRLAGGGSASPQRAAELRSVVRVDGLTALEHHVVGDVDNERDGPHAGKPETPAHPQRRGRRWVDASDRPRDETVAAERIVEDHRIAGRQVWHGDDGWVTQRQAVRRGRFAGYAAHG